MSQSIQEQFDQFNQENPIVLQLLEGMCREWFEAGNATVGIGMLFEVLRWTSGLTTTGDRYVLNNNYRSHYARLIMQRNPWWGDCFNTRTLRAA